MNNLFIDGTALTPLIDFNADQGVMRIQGRSIPDNPDEFWYKVLLWFDEYMMNSHSLTTFEVDLEYFNVTSSKRILALLYKLNDLINMNKDVIVVWSYRESDEDMYEVGQDYAYMVKVPFEFKSYVEPELALAI
jgi:hypothetical protein